MDSLLLPSAIKYSTCYPLHTENIFCQINSSSIFAFRQMKFLCTDDVKYRYVKIKISGGAHSRKLCGDKANCTTKYLEVYFGSLKTSKNSPVPKHVTCYFYQVWPKVSHHTIRRLEFELKKKLLHSPADDFKIYSDMYDVFSNSLKCTLLLTLASQISYQFCHRIK